LVNRDCILVWLAAEWDDTYRHPNKAAEEEQGSILRIYKDIIETLSTLEEQRRNRDALTIAEKGDVAVESASKASPARPGWIMDVSSFISKAAATAGESLSSNSITQSAANEADASRLQALSEILLLVSPIDLPIAAFLAVAKRLDGLNPSSQKAEALVTLFQASLYLSPTVLDLELRGDVLQDAVQTLKRAVAKSTGEVGEWVRRETRRCIFDGVE
jgi:hypothetical protein